MNTTLPPAANATPTRILVVEDESVVARDIQQQLGELGYTPVGHSTTGEHAIVLAGELRPDLVLMDIKLAGPMDGIAAARAIREQFALPVVFLTAFAENETLAQAKRSEPFGYVLKPFSERELHTVIQMALYRHSTETRLRDSEAQFRALFDTSLDGLIISAPDGRIFSANRSACAIFGHTEAQLCRLGRAGIIAPEDERLAGHLETRRRTGSTHGELTMVRGDGTRFEAEFSSALFHAGREERNGFSFREITQRKHHEREIGRLNRIYLVLSEVNRAIVQAKSQPELFARICRVLVESGPFKIAWIALHDADTRELVPVAVSDDEFGYAHAIRLSTDPATPEGCGPAGHAFRENRPYVCNDFHADPATAPWRERAARSGIRSSIALPLRRSGRAVALLTVYSGEKDFFLDREVALLVETADDVSFALDVLAGAVQRQAVEATLRLHSAALNAAADAIFITDRSGLIEWANPAFAALSQWPVEEVIGRNPRDLIKSGEHDAAFYRELWQTVVGGKVWRGEIVNRRRDGSLRTENMTITPLRDAHGEITHFISIKQDITDQKAMETHFLKAQRMEAIGALAGGVAHDLNNILAPIMMVTGVLREKFTDPDDRELLAMAQSSAQRGAEIVKQLLTFSRGQEGERTLVQPRHLLGEMIAMMRETFPRSLDLKQLLPGTLWTVLADPTQLHQVLLNLCVNARDAMPDGGRLTVNAANVTLAEGDPKLPLRAKPGPYVVISIADTGHGIPAEIQHRIFDPFFTTKPVGKGTGLGLSTVLGIVQAHGGFLDLESSVGSGTTFHVYLPAIPDGVEASTQRPAPRPAPVPSGQTILVVDDERDVRDSIRIILEKHNFIVITATDGEAGLAQFLKHRARLSLVITDLMMPKMNGLTLIRTLRAIDPLVKIVVNSGLTEVTERHELAELGVPDILMKPYDGPALLELVRTRLAAP
jgi:PAS domain S-box-containing protein